MTLTKINHKFAYHWRDLYNPFQGINLIRMITIEDIRTFALSFPGVEEKPHFHLPSFRVNDKIFATLWLKENRAMLKLSPLDQSLFVSYDSEIFFPVPGAWGIKGATFVALKKVRKKMFKDALTIAYNGVVKKTAKKKRIIVFK